MGRFINPFTDWGFKYLFGRTVSKSLLIDFLNCLLTGERRITDLKFMDKELSPEFKEQRGIIYDIYCKTDTGEYIIVEMQNRGQENFKERALFYLSKSIVRQGQKGDSWNYEIKAVYGVFFLNFALSDTLHDFRTDVDLMERASKQVFTDKMRMIFLELPKFKKSEKECENDFERWIFTLKHMEALEHLPFTKQKELFRKLEELAEIAHIDPLKRDEYEESLRIFRDNQATYDYAVKTGEKIGEERGVRIGEERGVKIGESRGIEKVARTMLAHDQPVTLIMQCTGLSLQDIKRLQSDTSQ